MDEALVVETYESNERIRRNATFVRITYTNDNCPRGCGARLQRAEHEFMQPGEVGRVLVVERCPSCEVEVRTSGLVLPGLTFRRLKAVAKEARP